MTIHRHCCHCRRISITVTTGSSSPLSLPPLICSPFSKIQVHITQGDHVGEGVIVSWITPNEPGSSTLLYWSEKSHLNYSAQGVFITYSYFNYTSGYLHHCTIDDLEFDTNFYQVGIGNTTRKFWFITLPGLGPGVPYTFGIIGNHT
ncbi:hypothetical protein G4B88_015897 [Cannabis sativa]|uniref:acid phosphatase n=1 Tax=Cannabis sativa TaxID=3483 RepID=A0A7J6G5R9_CANSA|nr:hypothetical protein G4B88_015897 [Cannabis sativa]